MRSTRAERLANWPNNITMMPVPRETSGYQRREKLN